MKNNCPCIDCINRKMDCHDHCGMYQNWKRCLDEQNEVIRKNKYDENMAIGYVVSVISKRDGTGRMI